MRCIGTGELRAYLDKELGPTEMRTVAAHIATCARCQVVLEDLTHVAGSVEQRLRHIYEEPTPPSVSEERSFAAMQARLRQGHPGGLSLAWSELRWNVGQMLEGRRVAAFAGLAVIALVAFFATTPMGQAAAKDLLSQFQTKEFKVVTVEPTQVAKVGFDLAHFGTVSGPVSGGAAPVFVNSIGEASQRVGFQVQQPSSLPADIKQAPQIAVTTPVDFSFKLDRAKARAYLDQTGHQSFDIPAKFDGATISVHVPAAALQVYGPLTEQVPVVIGEVPLVKAEVTGQVSLSEMRDFLLTLPGLSPELALQLRAIDDWTNTLPIPLPKDQASWREIDLGGTKALVLSDAQKRGTLVLWQKDGRVHGVGGSASADDLIRTAGSVH